MKIPTSKSNIVLIGMPGSGKSTVGVLLAKHLAMEFVDTDILIQTRENRDLQSIMDSEGYMALRQIEEEVLLDFDRTHHVVSTGGSAPYSQKGMENLCKNSVVVFLNVSIPVLKSRITNYESRGIAKPDHQSFEELFEERQVLYRRYADITINSDEINQDEVCEAITKAIEKDNQV
ncbi:shikimate kinase [Spirochaeta cellobiosiphila]|uniref:shikimate kinase n=1 Tax=Spirochaeta cellobiosiphila TaxID=504483 RepID=UPI00040DBDCA|nr:shikimate kinase [Spirochaeta cellobiosiphila]